MNSTAFAPQNDREPVRCCLDFISTVLIARCRKQRGCIFGIETPPLVGSPKDLLRLPEGLGDCRQAFDAALLACKKLTESSHFPMSSHRFSVNHSTPVAGSVGERPAASSYSPRFLPCRATPHRFVGAITASGALGLSCGLGEESSHCAYHSSQSSAQKVGGDDNPSGPCIRAVQHSRTRPTAQG